MKLMKHIKKIIAIGIIGVFSLGILAGCSPKETTYTQEQLDAQIDLAKQVGVDSVDITVDNNEVISLAVNDTIVKTNAEKKALGIKLE